MITSNGSAPTLGVTGTPPDDFTLTPTGSGSFTLAVTADRAPVITVPALQEVPGGQTTPIGGISISDCDAATYHETTSVTLSDTSGLLSVTPVAGATVTDNGTTDVTLSGTLSAVNQELSTLGYTAPASGVSDTISLATSDGRGGADTAQSIGIYISQPITSEAGLNSADHTIWMASRQRPAPTRSISPARSR